jgi:hypothetical protein
VLVPLAVCWYHEVIGQRLHAMMMQAAEPTLPVAANSEADTSTTT